VLAVYPDLLRWSDDMMRGQGQHDNPKTAEKMAIAAAEYSAYFAGVLTERRSCPRADLLSVRDRARSVARPWDTGCRGSATCAAWRTKLQICLATADRRG